MSEQVTEHPGRYESDLPDYPGYIQFPYPMMAPHMKAWWQKAIEDQKGKSRTDYDTFQAEWYGARELLLKFGEWKIEGVAVGDVENDSIPLEVQSFVEDCADDYIFPQLSEKKRRWLSSGI